LKSYEFCMAHVDFIIVILTDFSPKKKCILGLGPGCGPKPKPKINSEFNSMHFGVEINKRLKFLTPKNFWVLKNFLKILLYFSHIF